jgi:hypothetical protein
MWSYVKPGKSMCNTVQMTIISKYSFYISIAVFLVGAFITWVYYRSRQTNTESEHQNPSREDSHEDHLIELYKLNYEKLHEIHQSEIKSAWAATGLFLGATFATAGYVIATENITTGINPSSIFFLLAVVMLIHNLIGERLSYLNERRKEHLEELEKFFSEIMGVNNTPLKFTVYGINFRNPGKLKSFLREIGRNIKMRWVYWGVYLFFLLVASYPHFFDLRK